MVGSRHGGGEHRFGTLANIVTREQAGVGVEDLDFLPTGCAEAFVLGEEGARCTRGALAARTRFPTGADVNDWEAPINKRRLSV